VRKIVFCAFCLCLPLMAAVGARGENTPAQLPEIVVAPLREEQPVGPYNKPEWTTERRFPTTRVYLQQDPYQFGFEQWWRHRKYSDGTTQDRLQEEVEVGLPWRLQLDLYYNSIRSTGEDWQHEETSIELRHALADWGKIPLNPTLYGEYTFADNSDDDAVEGKLLLGDSVGHGWMYGINLIWERGVRGEEVDEKAVSAAIGYSLIDQTLGIGAEAQYKYETTSETRDDPEKSSTIGPSMQWRPIRRMHVDLVSLFGVSEDAPDLETYVVIGIDFGKVKHSEQRLSPVSLQSN
jgi:hypothetical protein